MISPSKLDSREGLGIKAQSILIDAAREATSDIITETKQEPYMRSETYDYGVMMRLRYMTLATDRPQIAHVITKRIFKESASNRKVDFAIPYLYSSETPFSPFETKPRAMGATPADL